MRKWVIIALMGAVAIPAIATAQTRELHRDRQEIREERRDVNQAIRRGESRSEIREERRDVREAQREYRDDWRDWKRSHRNDYRRPAYVGPRGHRYRPVGVGYRFAPDYYSSRYTIAEPWRYRLPRPSNYRRWIRYGNDIALVNIRTGRVIEVHRDFFW